MLKKIIMLLFTAMITLSVISCSDDNSVTPKEEQKVKELGLKEVTVPEPLKQSTDPHAQMCVGMINLVNGFKAYSAYYQPPDNVNLPKQFNSNDSWTKSWTYEQLTMTMDYFENETSFGWKIYLTGTDGEYNYSNWLSMEAEQKLDNSFGTLVIYLPVTDNVGFKWTCTTAQNGTGTFTIDIYEDDGTPSGKIEVTTNPDESGELNFYNYSNGTYVKESRITWTSAGTGHWEEYDEEGNISAQGDF